MGKGCEEQGLLQLCQPEKAGHRGHVPMVSNNDKPVTMGEEKADILHTFFLLQSSLALSLVFPMGGQQDGD